MAHQPQWPFELSIDTLAVLDPLAEFLDDNPEPSTDEDYYDAWHAAKEEASQKPTAIYIGESRQIGYLPGTIAKAFCWGR